MPGFYDPLVPETTIAPLREALEKRRLNQSPLEAQLKGFGSGALEGLRSLTSPAQIANLALMAVPAAGMARGAGTAVRGLQKLAPTLGLLEDAAPIAQMAPSADDVMSLLGQLKTNLAKVPQAGARMGSPMRPPIDARITGLNPGPTPPNFPTGPVNPFAEQAVTKYLRKP